MATYSAQIQAALAAGNVALARTLLEQAWQVAKRPADRKAAHDLGNAIQRAIFAQYLEQPNA